MKTVWRDNYQRTWSK